MTWDTFCLSYPLCVSPSVAAIYLPRIAIVVSLLSWCTKLLRVRRWRHRSRTFWRTIVYFCLSSTEVPANINHCMVCFLLFFFFFADLGYDMGLIAHLGLVRLFFSPLKASCWVRPGVVAHLVHILFHRLLPLCSTIRTLCFRLGLATSRCESNTTTTKWFDWWGGYYHCWGFTVYDTNTSLTQSTNVVLTVPNSSPINQCCCYHNSSSPKVITIARRQKFSPWSQDRLQ